MEIQIVLGAIPLAAVSGFVRGVTGFGGAMVLAPPMALLAGPRQAVLTALVLEGFAAVQMLPDAVRNGRMGLIGPICLAACLTVPLGTYLLATLDPELIRVWIASTVLAFAAVMLYGFRYRGRPRTLISVLLGAVSGAFAPATGIGAPPVILYLLAGPDPVAVTRANLTIFIMVISVVSLLSLLYRGVLEVDNGILALIAAPFFFLGVWIGTRVFPLIDEQRFRRYVLVLLILVSAVILAT